MTSWFYFSSSSAGDVLEHLYLTESCPKKYKIEEPGHKSFPIVWIIYSLREVLENSHIKYDSNGKIFVFGNFS